MNIGIAEAKDQLPSLIRAVEQGEKVIITRHGKPVAELTVPPHEKKEIQWGWAKGQYEVPADFDDPIDDFDEDNY
ncbi:MAG TPA: type II toxin-antitoxin system prevent-host-death family antitoxin [Terriglobales bacterium]